MHFFIEFVRSRLPATWRQNNTGWISGNCPVCVANGQTRPDRKRRGGFHFSEDEWVYHCFNCGYKTGWKTGSAIGGKVKKLLKQFGVEESELQRMSLGLMREQETAKLINPVPAAQPVYVPQWPEVALPEGAELLMDTSGTLGTNFEAGVVMLDQRELLHWTDWAYTGKDFKYRKRMILPYRYHGKIVGHNARYIGNPPNSETPKYLVSKPAHHVFNLDRQNPDRDVVIVVEGDFDAISIDAVALGSNSLSREQASLINQLKRRTILLPDADKAGRELVEPAIAQGWSISFPEWMETCKDANQASVKYGRAFVLRSVLAAATDNPTKIRVLAKRYLRD
jgi:DNA primase